MYTGICLQIIQAGPVGQCGSSRAAEVYGRLRDGTARYGRLRDGPGRWDLGTAHASCTEDTAEGTRTPLPPRPFCETSCEYEVTSCKVCPLNLKEILSILNAFILGKHFVAIFFLYFSLIESAKTVIGADTKYLLRQLLKM